MTLDINTLFEAADLSAFQDMGDFFGLCSKALKEDLAIINAYCASVENLDEAESVIDAPARKTAGPIIIDDDSDSKGKSHKSGDGFRATHPSIEYDDPKVSFQNPRFIIAKGGLFKGDKVVDLAKFSSEKDKTIKDVIVDAIKKIVTWLLGCIRYVIGGITNMCRKVVGLKTEPLEDLLKSSKDIFKKDAPIETYDKQRSYVSRSVADSYLSHFGNLSQAFLKENEETVQVITLDNEQDLAELKLAIEAFLNLFDNARGSNNEDLFKTDDLEQVLSLIKVATDRYRKGEFDDSGLMFDVSSVRDQRAKTIVNIDKLRVSFLQIERIIKSIFKNILAKRQAAPLGLSYIAIYNQRTNAAIENILKIMKPRFKEALKYQKDLESIKGKYEKYLKKLNDCQYDLSKIITTNFSNPLVNKMRNFLDGASYMLDMINSRMTGLAIYIKTLKDIYDALVGFVLTPQSAATKFNIGGILKRFKLAV